MSMVQSFSFWTPQSQDQQKEPKTTFVDLQEEAEEQGVHPIAIQLAFQESASGLLEEQAAEGMSQTVGKQG